MYLYLSNEMTIGNGGFLLLDSGCDVIKYICNSDSPILLIIIIFAICNVSYLLCHVHIANIINLLLFGLSMSSRFSDSHRCPMAKIKVTMIA